jgi:hypothetical protein
MNMNNSLIRLSHSRIPLLAIVSLILMTLSFPALCGEIHDAVKAESSLEADAFIISGNSYNSTLVLQITNSSETPQTILTEHYEPGIARIVTGSGNRITHIFLSYEILTIGTAEQPEQSILIPSLSKLAPVTLRKGETAQISMPLDAATVYELKKEDERPIRSRSSTNRRQAALDRFLAKRQFFQNLQSIFLSTER